MQNQAPVPAKNRSNKEVIRGFWLEHFHFGILSLNFATENHDSSQRWRVTEKRKQLHEGQRSRRFHACLNTKSQQIERQITAIYIAEMWRCCLLKNYKPSDGV